jgi:hypothetical protein
VVRQRRGARCRGVIVRKFKTTPLTAPREWVPLKGEFDRVMPIAGAPDLAALHLYGGLLNLQPVVVYIAPDKKHTVTWLTPSNWEKWRQVRTLAGDVMEPPVRGYCFVRRVDRDKLFPIAATPAPTPHADGRRKPGPQPEGDWPEHVTREVIRRLLAGEKFPSAPAMLQWCLNTLDLELDPRQMQRFLRDLRTQKKFSLK